MAPQMARLLAVPRETVVARQFDAGAARAVGLVLTMIGAALTHLRRAEYGAIAVAAVLLILAAFVAYGRYFVLPA